MAEIQRPVASAVIVPDSAEQIPSPSRLPKRRQSSLEDERAKRQRLSDDLSRNGQDATKDKHTPTDDKSDRRKSGQIEERKRGQRLFGALLGTLSQSSSSTAQRRRTDIEKKQQAKLKLQAEEHDEKNKQRLESLMVVRRREQKKYNKQSMQIRHSSLLARAQFLRTRSEPELYYKPWELLPGDEAIIKRQIEEAEDIIEKETSQFEADNPPVDDNPPSATNEKPPESSQLPADPSETVGSATNLEERFGSELHDDTNPGPKSPDMSNTVQKAIESSEAQKDHGDDAGEIVLEGEEDTVIY